MPATDPDLTRCSQYFELDWPAQGSVLLTFDETDEPRKSDSLLMADELWWDAIDVIWDELEGKGVPYAEFPKLVRDFNECVGPWDLECEPRFYDAQELVELLAPIVAALDAEEVSTGESRPSKARVLGALLSFCLVATGVAQEGDWKVPNPFPKRVYIRTL